MSRLRASATPIGRYHPGDSLLHRADPRSKLVASVLYVAVLFLVRGYPPLLLMAGLLGAGFLVARVPPAWLYRGMRPVLLLAAVTFVFQLFFYGEGATAHLGPLTVYQEGIREGGFLAARLVLLVLSGTLLVLTTQPLSLTDGLARLLSPLARLRFPVYELALMMTIALRFIPTLLDEFERISLAQAARGADLGRGGPWSRARNTLPVLVPLFVLSFRRADDLALAMEARCWRGGRGRTSRRVLAFGWRDAVLAVAVAAVLAAALWIGRFR